MYSKSRTKLYNAIQKYGRNNFKIELICYCLTQDIANKMEVYFIEQCDSVNAGYNIRLGGNSGGKLSDETKRKISESKKGSIPWNCGHLTPIETRRKISNSMMGNMPWSKGKSFSNEYRKKLSDAKKGRPSNMAGKHHSDDTKKRLSEKNRKFTDDEELDIAKQYDKLKSSTKVADIFNCHPLTIRNIIKRIRGSL